jgi:hypothetical protein
MLLSQKIGFVADAILIISSVTWLLDFTPFDYMSKKNDIGKISSILETLLRSKAIVKSGNNFSSNFDYETSDEGVSVLADFLRKSWVEGASVEWSRLVGIGISNLNIPIAGQTGDGFKGLYLMLIPVDPNATSIDVVAVGLVEKLEAWIQELHKRNIIWWVGSTLILGFSLQLLSRILSINNL